MLALGLGREDSHPHGPDQPGSQVAELPGPEPDRPASPPLQEPLVFGREQGTLRPVLLARWLPRDGRAEPQTLPAHESAPDAARAAVFEGHVQTDTLSCAVPSPQQDILNLQRNGRQSPSRPQTLP